MSVQPRDDGQASSAEGHCAVRQSPAWVHPRDEGQASAAEGQLEPSVGRHTSISLQPRALGQASTAEQSVSYSPGVPVAVHRSPRQRALVVRGERLHLQRVQVERELPRDGFSRL